MRVRKLDYLKSAVREGYEVHGKSLVELAQVYNCSTGTIRRCLNSQGVEIRPRGRPKKIKEEETTREEGETN